MTEERAWITAADGTRLAARLWLPEETPAAVLLEALPYRMDDLTSSYTSEYERLCTEGGFAVCRLDLRGTGSSEGIATDEYTPEEHSDICETIAWLASVESAHVTGRVFDVTGNAIDERNPLPFVMITADTTHHRQTA